jgi:alcohol dehydrogenase class IV
MALNGLQKIRKLLQDCSIPDSLKDLGIKTKDISSLAKSAMKVQRLLKNNPRKIELEDAVKIYESAF